MKEWKKSPTELVEAFYEVMKDFKEAELRTMFGYPCAFFNGNMVVGLHESNFAVRLNQNDREGSFATGEGEVFAPMAGRVMKEYSALSDEVIYDRKAVYRQHKAQISFLCIVPSPLFLAMGARNWLSASSI